MVLTVIYNIADSSNKKERKIKEELVEHFRQCLYIQLPDLNSLTVTINISFLQNVTNVYNATVYLYHSDPVISDKVKKAISACQAILNKG